MLYNIFTVVFVKYILYNINNRIFNKNSDFIQISEHSNDINIY